MNILLSLRRQEQYYRLFLGGFAAMPLTIGIIKRLIRFIRNKYNKTSENCKTPFSEVVIGRNIAILSLVSVDILPMI